jgi:hypothetical protein
MKYLHLNVDQFPRNASINLVSPGNFKNPQRNLQEELLSLLLCIMYLAKLRLNAKSSLLSHKDLNMAEEGTPTRTLVHVWDELNQQPVGIEDLVDDVHRGCVIRGAAIMIPGWIVHRKWVV